VPILVGKNAGLQSSKGHAMAFEFPDTLAKIVIRTWDAVERSFRATPDETAGEVYLKVVENEGKSSQPIRNPEAWVGKTAWRSAKRHFVRHKRSSKCYFDEKRDAFSVANRQPDGVLAQLERREEEEARLRLYEAAIAAKDRLPRKQWLAFLVVNELRSHDPTATDLPDTAVGLATLWGCSPKNIYKLSTRAERKLRRWIR
jgi:hypothetical protein